MGNEKALINNASYISNNEGTPKQITDQAAYDEYLRLKSNPILNEKKFLEATDGTVINLGLFPQQLQKKIEHLPGEEQLKILKLKSIYFQIHCRMNGMKTKAFGKQVDENGHDKRSAFEKKEQEMIELFGRMFGIREVYEICTQEWKIRCTSEQVKNFRAGHLGTIAAKIEEHKRTYSDIRLGHKRSRLEELTWLYQKRKAIYNASNKADDHRLLLQTIEQIRKECEGDKLTIDAVLNHNIDGIISEHVQKDLTKNLSIKELIIARVASKTNTSAVALVAALSKGHYAQILEHHQRDAEIEYPSIQTYDFDRISRIATAREEEEKEAIIAPISLEVVKNGLDIKAILLAKLTQKKGDVQSELNDLNPHFIDKANR